MVFILKQMISWLYPEQSSFNIVLNLKMCKTRSFKYKPVFYFTSFISLSLSVSQLPFIHSKFSCHENELLICFPKEFLMPCRPDSRNTTVVVWSTNNFPGLHCLSKALFHPALIMGKMSLSKVSLLLFLHKDVRWRELEFANMLIHISVNSALPPQSLRVHSACWKFPVLEQHKCAFDKMPFNWRKTGMWSYVKTIKRCFMHSTEIGSWLKKTTEAFCKA